MRIVNRLLLLLGVALLSTVVFPRILPAVFRPDLFAVLLIFLVLHMRRDQVLQACWIVGLGKDLATGGPLGGAALIYLIAAVILLWAQRRLKARNAVSLVAMGFCMAFLTEFILLAPVMFRAGGVLVGDALWTLFLASLVTAGIMPLSITLLHRLKRPLGLDRRIVFGVR